MFEEPKVEIPVEKVKKVRKPRKPMSEEQKQVLRERLAKAREAKKLKKERNSAPKVEKPKVEKKITIETIEKPKPVLKPVPVVDEFAEMRKQLADLKTLNKNQERQLLKQQLAAEKSKMERNKKPLPVIKEESVSMPISTPTPQPTKPVDIPPKKKRYSTYKKSIWSQFD